MKKNSKDRIGTRIQLNSTWVPHRCSDNTTTHPTPHFNNMSAEAKDKSGQPIHEGDHVFARSRGGRHEGDVEKVVTAKEEAEAEQEGVKHPPKVSEYRRYLLCGWFHA